MKISYLKQLLLNINESFPVFIILLFYLSILIVAIEVNVYLAVILLIGVILLLRKFKGRLFFLVLLLMFAYFQYQIKIKTEIQLQKYYERDVLISGLVNNYPLIKDGKITLNLMVNKINGNQLEHESLVETTIIESDTIIKYFDKIECSGKFSNIKSWQNDFFKAKSLEGFIVCDSVKVLDNKEKLDVIGFFIQVRYNLSQKIEKQLHHPYDDLLFGIIFGGDADYSEHFKLDLQNSGTTHIIAVSGYNVDLVMSSLLFFSTNIKRKYLIVLSSIVLMIYLFFVGFDNIPAKRAVIMQFYVIGSWLSGKKASALYGLCITTIFLFLENIFVYKSLSFQLSFAATIGIIVFREPVITYITKILKNQVLSDALGISLIANICTLPIICFYFEKISLISLFVNIIIAPLIPIIFILGILFISLIFFKINFTLLSYGIFWILNLLIQIIDWSGSLSFAIINTKMEPVIFVIFILIIIFGLCLIIYKNHSYE